VRKPPKVEDFPTPENIVPMLDRTSRLARGDVRDEDEDSLLREALAEVDADDGSEAAERLERRLAQYVNGGVKVPGLRDRTLFRMRLRAVRELISLAGDGDDGIRMRKMIERVQDGEHVDPSEVEEVTEDDRVQAARELAEAAFALTSSIFERGPKRDAVAWKRERQRLAGKSSDAAKARHDKRAERTAEPLRELLDEAEALRSDGVARKVAAGKLHANEKYSAHWTEKRIYTLIGDVKGGRWRRGDLK
jgi:hypothetical protein